MVTADPVHLHGDLLAVVDDRDDDPLHEQSHDGLALVVAGGLGGPEGGKIAGELADPRALLGRQRGRLARHASRILGLELILRGQGGLPILFQGARHQPILRLDRAILPLGTRGFVTGALQAL